MVFFDPADYLDVDPAEAGSERVAARPRRNAEQRAALCEAMTQIAAQGGFGEASAQKAFTRAGLGSGTFYRIYESREDCLREAFERCGGTVLERVADAAAREVGECSDQFGAGLRELLALFAAHPEVARLLLVEILAGDDKCREARERWLERLAGLLASRSTERPPRTAGPAWLAAGALAGTLARELAGAEAAPRPQLLEELSGVAMWAHRGAAVEVSRGEAPAVEEEYESVEAARGRREAVKRARSREAQRGRILAAMTEVVGTKGYAAARVADILECAELSVPVFYAHFEGKQECLLAAFEVELKRITERVKVAVERKTTCASKAEIGLRALVESLAERPAAARTVMIEVRVSGNRGEKRHEEALSSLTHLIGEPGNTGQGDGAHEVARMVAVGLADMIASEVGEGRAARLEEQLPQLVFTALAPYFGGERAAERAAAASRAQAR